MKIPELAALLCYFVLVLYIGIYFFLKDRKKAAGEKDYFLGGRDMNGWVSALSAGASDMSAWVLMGLPGAIYLLGLGQVWIALGDGRIISPCLKESNGNVAFGTLFDYDPEVEPSADFVTALYDTLK